MIKITTWIMTLCVSLVSVAFAQTAFIEGDIENGAEIYGNQCIACHGVAGNSIVPLQPIIAGQYAEYLVEQLHSYKSGLRKNATMEPFTSALSDSDINDVSLYLEAQTAGLSGATDEELANQGRLIYLNGIVENGVPNCTGCHSPAGKGIPPIYPKISGQHADYTIVTLTEFRAGTRVNSVMNDIAKELSDEEIAALAQYISGLY